MAFADNVKIYFTRAFKRIKKRRFIKNTAYHILSLNEDYPKRINQDGNAVIAKLQKLIRGGEGVTVEFKRCKSGLSSDAFETVSAFSNRYGGHIIFGVEDTGKVCGINPNTISDIKKNFANTLNNFERFAPTLFIELEEAEIDGKTVLWCYVPPTSQLVMFGGKIYDRANDGDMDITRNTEMVAHLYQRKRSDYSERKLFPYAKERDFDFERLMPKVRRMAVNRFKDHPWGNMSDMEILKSAGLYHDEDCEVGKSGYNLAAILLFGRDDLILSCTANYITDAICRRENLDRYDDRSMVTTNLIDAYDQLIEFINKHTLDRFFIIGTQSVSVRSYIARELVSNSLVHREYTSAFPAKIIIERDRIVTENWTLPKAPGAIDPNNFIPCPRNPILSRFFVNIGRADILGSGIRNLYKYTKIYSGGEPELIDGDIFRTIVPLGSLDDDIAYVTDKDEKDTGNGTDDPENGGIDPENRINDPENGGIDPENGMDDPEKRIVMLIDLIRNNAKISMQELSEILKVNSSTIKRDIQKLKGEGLIERVGPDKGGHWKVIT